MWGIIGKDAQVCKLIYYAYLKWNKIDKRLKFIQNAWLPQPIWVLLWFLSRLKQIIEVYYNL